jgi:hypothetical protein
MTALNCPTSPGYREFTPIIVQRSTIVESYAGADIQRVNRLGDRFGAVITLPVMREQTASEWLGWWLAGQSAVVSIPWLDRQAAPRGYGTPLVNGANQLGQSLVCDGFAPNARIDAGKPFSILSGTRRHLCVTTARATANGSGQVTLPIWPTLRWSPADNATIEIDAPRINGLIMPEENPFTPRMAGLVEWRFMVREV